MKLLVLTFGLVLALSRPALATTSCGAPGDQHDGWETAAPATVGIDPGMLCRLALRFGEWKDADLHAILIARHDKLIFEQYYTGSDQSWGKPAGIVTFGPAASHDLRSITKSVVALLLGIGIEKGWVHDIDQPILSLLPSYSDLRTPEKDRITVRDVLTMSAGLAWNEDLPYGDPLNSETQLDSASDPCRFVLEQPVANPSGSVWTYSGGSAALIACVLRKTTRHSIDELARVHLFEPLGISSVEWARYPLTGEPVAASGLRLLPRDTLKFGQLVLNRGNWHGNQVVPATWIDAATTPQINGLGLMFYGYQFWLGRSLVARREVDWIAGIGYGGQRLYIMPSLDLVVLIHAGLYTNPMQEWVGNMLLNRFVLTGTVP